MARHIERVLNTTGGKRHGPEPPEGLIARRVADPFSIDDETRHLVAAIREK